MMEAKRPALIINPVAGPIWRRKKTSRLIAHLGRLYPNLTVHRTAQPGDARRIASELSSLPSDLILTAGGDGTYHEVINGLSNFSIPLAFVPMGSGNNLVRELGFPTNPFRAATLIRKGVARPIYLGQLDTHGQARGAYWETLREKKQHSPPPEGGALWPGPPVGIDPASTANERGRLHPAIEKGTKLSRTHNFEVYGEQALREGATQAPMMDHRLFALMVGSGFDAYVVKRVPPRKKWMGIWSYVPEGLLSLFRYDYEEIIFRIDGRKLKGTAGIITKSRYYGGPFILAPTASLNRSELILCLFKGRGPLCYFRYSLGLITGMIHRMKDVEFHHATRIDIETPVPLQADGEYAGIGPVKVSIGPKTLSVVHPAIPTH